MIDTVCIPLFITSWYAVHAATLVSGSRFVSLDQWPCRLALIMIHSTKNSTHKMIKKIVTHLSQNFVHGTTAELSCYVQNYDSQWIIGVLITAKHNFIRYGIWAHESFVKRSPGSESAVPKMWPCKPLCILNKLYPFAIEITNLSLTNQLFKFHHFGQFRGLSTARLIL